MDIRGKVIAAICQADLQEACGLMDRWAEEHGYERVLSEVLEPALLEMGEKWRSAGSFTLAQAYVAGKLAEMVLANIAQHVTRGPQALAAKGPVIIGNIEDDFHALGRRMVGIFLRTEGWDVRDLGNDVLSGTFIDTAVATGARIIGVSAMTLETAHNIRALRDEIDRRGLGGRIQLAVGGAVFLVCPGLVEEVGGDGTAPNAMGAATLFDQLWERSTRSEVHP